jgi:hypothetical protein
MTPFAGMTALTVGLGPERVNGRKDGKLKEQMDDTTHAQEVLNRTKPETLERRQ